MTCKIALPLRLAGVHDVFHVSALKRYFCNPMHMIDFTMMDLSEDLRYRPLRILAQEVKESIESFPI